MRGQGVLSSITQALKTANRDIQLDMLDTLCILLTNNEQNKLEFAKLDGYESLADLFLTITPREQYFVSKSLRSMRNIILDGESGRYVGNA